MYYVTPFGVSTIGLVLFKSCYLNEDIITDNITETAKLINSLLPAVSFTFSLRQKLPDASIKFFFTVANTACLKTKANEFQGKFPVTFIDYDVHRSYRSRVAADATKPYAIFVL